MDIVDREIISLFADGFSSTLESPDLEKTIQHVKGRLFDRDYLAAFGCPEYLFAYFVRWSPARALAYRDLFCKTQPIHDLFEQKEPGSVVSVVSIGGGAGAEIVALASIALLESSSVNIQCRLTAIDIADWSPVVQQAQQYIERIWFPWNERKRAANSSSLPPFTVDFVHGDVLDTGSHNQVPWATTDLITCMFTTNELFAENKRGTVQLLQRLNTECKSGALLLIVESAGSYSEIQIGNKKFPVQFLIKHTLQSSWDEIVATDSQWYRLPANVSYKLSLENTHFFIRLYRHK